VVPVIVIGTSGMHAGILLNAIWGGIAGAISAGIVALIKSARMSNDPLPGETTDGKMTAGLVLGSIGLVAWLLPIVGIPVSVAGTIISAPLLEKTRTKRARIALVLCLAGAIASLANSMYGIAINQR